MHQVVEIYHSTVELREEMMNQTKPLNIPTEETECKVRLLDGSGMS